jgi:hypothetical protein
MGIDDGCPLGALASRLTTKEKIWAIMWNTNGGVPLKRGTVDLLV